MDMETLPKFLAMAEDPSSKWEGCFLPIKQTEYFVEEKTAEEECLTEMPNVSPNFLSTKPMRRGLTLAWGTTSSGI
jgi:hypothetical protein